MSKFQTIGVLASMQYELERASEEIRTLLREMVVDGKPEAEFIDRHFACLNDATARISILSERLPKKEE